MYVCFFSAGTVENQFERGCVSQISKTSHAAQSSGIIAVKETALLEFCGVALGESNTTGSFKSSFPEKHKSLRLIPWLEKADPIIAI